LDEGGARSRQRMSDHRSGLPSVQRLPAQQVALEIVERMAEPSN
jgi:hypothetical protein